GASLRDKTTRSLRETPSVPPGRQSVLDELQPFGGAPFLPGTALGDSGRDHPRAAGHMIPRDDPIVEAELHVGDFEIVVAGTRDALQHHAPVGAHVPGDARLYGEAARAAL